MGCGGGDEGQLSGRMGRGGGSRGGLGDRGRRGVDEGQRVCAGEKKPARPLRPPSHVARGHPRRPPTHPQWPEATHEGHPHTHTHQYGQRLYSSYLTTLPHMARGALYSSYLTTLLHLSHIVLASITGWPTLPHTLKQLNPGGGDGAELNQLRLRLLLGPPPPLLPPRRCHDWCVGQPPWPAPGRFT